MEQDLSQEQTTSLQEQSISSQDNPQKIYDFVYEGTGERLDVYLTRVQ